MKQDFRLFDSLFFDDFISSFARYFFTYRREVFGRDVEQLGITNHIGEGTVWVFQQVDELLEDVFRRSMSCLR